MDLIEITISGRPAHDVPALPDAAREALAGTAMMYREAGYEPPWIGYLAIENSVAVGTCAFKNAPSGGRVEVAYFTFPGHEGHGVATRMCRNLVRLAHAAAPDVTIAAQTLPEPNASTRVLAKLGFRLFGELEDPEDGRVWEWRLEPAPDASATTIPSIHGEGSSPSQA